MANKALDIVGRKFGLLTVEKRVGYEDGKSTWLCKCTCGETIVTKGVYLTRGATRSCGCLASGNHRTHGKSYSPEYRSWMAMKTRCLNQNNHRHWRYGPLGIAKRWMSFENFYADMGKRPERTSLERIDNHKGYSPSNCRWATMTEQGRNKINNRIITWNGKEYCLKALSELCGIKRTTLQNRLNVGWSLTSAILTPVIRKGGRS